MERTVIEKLWIKECMIRNQVEFYLKILELATKKKVVDIKKAYLVMDFVIVIFVLIQIKPFLKR